MFFCTSPISFSLQGVAQGLGGVGGGMRESTTSLSACQVFRQGQIKFSSVIADIFGCSRASSYVLSSSRNPPTWPPTVPHRKWTKWSEFASLGLSRFPKPASFVEFADARSTALVFWPNSSRKKATVLGEKKTRMQRQQQFPGPGRSWGQNKKTHHFTCILTLEIRHDSLTNSNWTAVVSENVCCVRMVLGIFSFCKSYFHSPSGEHVSAICMHAENKCWRGNNLWEEEIAGNFLGNMGWSRASTSPLEGVSKLFRAFFFGIFFPPDILSCLKLM